MLERFTLESTHAEASNMEDTCARIAGDIMLGIQENEWWGADLAHISAISEWIDEIHRALFRIRKECERRLRIDDSTLSD